MSRRSTAQGWAVLTAGLGLSGLAACFPRPQYACGSEPYVCCADATCYGWNYCVGASAGVAPGRCAACGSLDGPCCDALNAACRDEGAECHVPRGAARGVCRACGRANGRCCDGTRCVDGSSCAPATTPGGLSGTCVTCGLPGQPCCERDRCHPGAMCRTQLFSRPTCAACGAVGQLCCAGPEGCPSGTECTQVSQDYRCVACGLHGQSCCTGTRSPCTGALMCDLTTRLCLPPPPQPCGTFTECPAPARCDRQYPGGLCRRDCDSDAACDPGFVCDTSPGACVPQCSLGRSECRPFGAVCVMVPGRAVLACEPSCLVDEVAGEPPCARGLACDAHSGRCSVGPSTGAETGAPCGDHTACRSGACLVEPSPPSRADLGFIGGYCVARARWPSGERVTVGGAVPRSNCPLDAAAVVPGVFAPAGPVVESVACMRRCESDGDCREGYRCAHGEAPGGGPLFRDGLCLPIECGPAAMCPAGFDCVPVVPEFPSGARRCQRRS